MNLTYAVLGAADELAITRVARLTFSTELIATATRTEVPVAARGAGAVDEVVSSAVQRTAGSSESLYGPFYRIEKQLGGIGDLEDMIRSGELRGRGYTEWGAAETSRGDGIHTRIHGAVP
jgi:hypothetical protein